MKNFSSLSLILTRNMQLRKITRFFFVDKNKLLSREGSAQGEPLALACMASQCNASTNGESQTNESCRDDRRMSQWQGS